MFTGIVETMGKIIALQKEENNLHLTIESSISAELKIDQSVSHNGICLTVVETKDNTHRVTAIDETLQKTNLATLKVNDEVNLERCLKIGDRLDGHMVQGHVDQKAKCTSIKESKGSWVYTFQYQPTKSNVVVEKGSICVNGISLTVFDVKDDLFSVAVIPYTYDHTNIKHVKEGSLVNLEFDIIGKYVTRMMEFKA
jgi:riboflavin synthase